MEDSQLLKISEVAELAGVLPSTIRHYTDLGLLSFAETTEGGHRLYKEWETLSRLARIKRLASRGATLPEIKAELSGESRRKILVVDDEQEVRDLVVDSLKDRYDFDIRTAADGFTAGRILGDFIPDLVVLDLMLPGVDGFQVCRQIRDDISLAETKILSITGYDTAENAKKILEAGADKFMVKPLNARDFVKMAAELLKITLKNPT
jgi:CheY-like chemotaxis protein